MTKVKIKQFKNKAKEPVAGLTPEHAVYDANGVRLDAKLGSWNLSNIRDAQTESVRAVREAAKQYDHQTVINNGTITNAADEEDITVRDNVLSFKDRTYIEGVDEMGYVILRKNKSFAEQVTKKNTIYEIRYDFNFGDTSFEIPNNCIVIGNGGSIKNAKRLTLSTNAKIYNLTICNFERIILNENSCLYNCVLDGQYNSDGVYVNGDSVKINKCKFDKFTSRNNNDTVCLRDFDTGKNLKTIKGTIVEECIFKNVMPKSGDSSCRVVLFHENEFDFNNNEIYFGVDKNLNVLESDAIQILTDLKKEGDAVFPYAFASAFKDSFGTIRNNKFYINGYAKSVVKIQASNVSVMYNKIMPDKTSEIPVASIRVINTDNCSVEGNAIYNSNNLVRFITAEYNSSVVIKHNRYVDCTDENAVSMQWCTLLQHNKDSVFESNVLECSNTRLLFAWQDNKNLLVERNHFYFKNPQRDSLIGNIETDTYIDNPITNSASTKFYNNTFNVNGDVNLVSMYFGMDVELVFKRNTVFSNIPIRVRLACIEGSRYYFESNEWGESTYIEANSINVSSSNLETINTISIVDSLLYSLLAKNTNELNVLKCKMSSLRTCVTLHDVNNLHIKETKFKTYYYENLIRVISGNCIGELIDIDSDSTKINADGNSSYKNSIKFALKSINRGLSVRVPENVSGGHYYYDTNLQMPLFYKEGIGFSDGNADVYVYYHTSNETSWLCKPDSWKTMENQGNIADGICVVVGDKVLVVSLGVIASNCSFSSKSGTVALVPSKTDALMDFSGKSKTKDIITSAVFSTDTNDYAPKKCNEYSTNGTNSGDWWLPSIGELSLIFANINKINFALSRINGASQIGTGYYISSSESTNSGIWSYYYTNSQIGPFEIGKTNQRNVIAVSEFK